MYRLLFSPLFLLLALSGCKSNVSKYESQGNKIESIVNNRNSNISPNYHNTIRNHNYRHSSETKDYDVSGYDDEGNYVYGEVEMDDKYGYGYVYDENGNDIYLDVEWQGKDELEGTDENGITYNLETD